MDDTSRDRIARTITVSLLVSCLISGLGALLLAYRTSGEQPAECASPEFPLECAALLEAQRRAVLLETMLGVGLSGIALLGYLAGRVGKRPAQPSSDA